MYGRKRKTWENGIVLAIKLKSSGNLMFCWCRVCYCRFHSCQPTLTPEKGDRSESLAWMGGLVGTYCIWIFLCFIYPKVVWGWYRIVCWNDSIDVKTLYWKTFGIGYWNYKKMYFLSQMEIIHFINVVTIVFIL